MTNIQWLKEFFRKSCRQMPVESSHVPKVFCIKDGRALYNPHTLYRIPFPEFRLLVRCCLQKHMGG